MKIEAMLYLKMLLIFCLLFANTQALSQDAIFSNSILTLPVVIVGENYYSAELQLKNSDPIEFILKSASQLSRTQEQGATTFINNSLSIPLVHIGGMDYSAKLDLISDNPLIFRLVFVQELGNIPSNGTNSPNELFNKLDAELAKKSVSTNSPEGLWLIYSYGFTHFSDITDITRSTVDETEIINLQAFVISVYSAEDRNGDPRIYLLGCAGASSFHNRAHENAAVLGIPLDSLTNQFSIRFNSLSLMSTPNFGYNKTAITGSTNTDTNINTNSNQKVNVSLVNNREMVFASEFIGIDTEGEKQGSLNATFKGRKISDNVNTTLGSIEVNNIAIDTHCYSYVNKSSSNTLNMRTKLEHEESHFFQSHNTLSDPASNYYLSFRIKSSLNDINQVVPDRLGYELGNFSDLVTRDWGTLRDFSINQSADLSTTIDFNDITDGVDKAVPGTAEANF